LIVGAFVLIILGQYYEDELDTWSPQIDCPDEETTKDEAYTD
jgi:hypothetical protein